MIIFSIEYNGTKSYRLLLEQKIFNHMLTKQTCCEYFS